MTDKPVILIAEDDTAVSKRLQKHFPNHEYEVIVHDNLEHTLQTLGQKKVAGAITDGRFFRYSGDQRPDTCGLELAEALQEKSIPAVLHSSEANPDFLEAVGETGASIVPKTMSAIEQSASEAAGTLKQLMAKVAKTAATVAESPVLAQVEGYVSRLKGFEHIKGLPKLHR